MDDFLLSMYIPHGLTSVHLILSRNSFPEKAPEYHITCHYHCCAARTLQEMFVDSHWQITFILMSMRKESGLLVLNWTSEHIL